MVCNLNKHKANPLGIYYKLLKHLEFCGVPQRRLSVAVGSRVGLIVKSFSSYSSLG